MIQRKPNRLIKFDYSSNGYYFVTLNVKNLDIKLCDIVGGRVCLRKEGCIVKECWEGLVFHYENCFLDKYVIMPDHFHGIVKICNPFDNELVEYKIKKWSLSEIIRGFKTYSSKNINIYLGGLKKFYWHKSFYDRIIKNKEGLVGIRRYIKDNPENWVRE